MVARTRISDGYRARAHAIVALARSWRPAEVMPGARTWADAQAAGLEAVRGLHGHLAIEPPPTACESPRIVTSRRPAAKATARWVRPRRPRRRCFQSATGCDWRWPPATATRTPPSRCSARAAAAAWTRPCCWRSPPATGQATAADPRPPGQPAVGGRLRPLGLGTPTPPPTVRCPGRAGEPAVTGPPAQRRQVRRRPRSTAYTTTATTTMISTHNHPDMAASLIGAGAAQADATAAHPSKQLPHGQATSRAGIGGHAARGLEGPGRHLHAQGR